MGLVAHVVVSQNVFENLEVLGFIDACIFTYFIEIGESAPLTCFMGYVGLSHGVKMILETIVVLGGRLFLGPGQATCPSLYMILVARLPLPSVAYRCSGIYCLGSFFSQYSTNLVTHSTQRPLGSFPHANMQ